MEQLKPCPFCGGKAELIDYGDEFVVLTNHEDDCWMDEYDLCIDISTDEKQQAIEAWNTRFEPTCTNVQDIDIIPTTYFECSECCFSMELVGMTANWIKRCPNCGAKVVKE